MKSASAIVLAGLCATLAAATPLDKRAYETKYELVTVTVTVTGYPPAETAAPTEAAPAAPTETVPAAAGTTFTFDSSDRGSWSWGGWKSGGWGGGTGSSWTQPAASASASEAPAEQPATSSSDFGSGGGGSPAPSSATATSEAPASTAPTTVSSDYQQGILDSHNIHRANHSVASLSWSDSMASIAAQIAASCVYAHDTSTGGGGYGQNIGAGSLPEDIPAMITNLMYNGEINFYPGYGGEPSMSNFDKWGHFSQIVWKSTTQVGCATQYCPGGLANTGGSVSPYFTVCNYSPPGNFGGQYGANVLAPQGNPTVTL